MSPGLLKVVERAQREPEGRFHSLAHRLDVPARERAYHRLRKDAAVGVDGIAKEPYGQALEKNLQDLHARLRSRRYRPPPIRRVHSPKGTGKTRPIGISAFEDKRVQDAVREAWEAIDEQDFLGCSYGVRPGRRAHDALRALDRIVHRGEGSWILEADLGSFFDSLDRTQLKERLEIRGADGSLLRLIGKGWHVGVLDGAEFTEPETGTAQGSVLSPLLGNVYLHDGLDLGFETEVKPRRRGRATLLRGCDDFVLGFERADAAQRVRAVLEKRLARLGRTLHPDKTRLLAFRRPLGGPKGGKGPATFDFLGFTLDWARSREGRWGMWCKTRRASLRRAIQSVYEGCRRPRHLPVQVQHTALGTRLRGHFNYFGVRGNFRTLRLVAPAARRAWFKWLCRRSQRKRLNGERFADLLERLPLPRPRITVRIGGP
jgi:group II intron reverse transcriptase/maturase